MEPVFSNEPALKSQGKEDESCFPWDISQVRGATVSVIRLMIPLNARREFAKACQDFNKQKLAEAEQHVRNAIGNDGKYVAAWVMLGEILVALRKDEEAQAACLRANGIDSTYLPPYICLAEIDLRVGHWEEALNVTKAALGLNPTGDSYAYVYRAIADLELNRLAEAEQCAIEAIAVVGQRDAAAHYLLANIYEAEGKRGAAASEVRSFLKINRDKQKDQQGKRYLASLVQESSK